MIDWDLTREHYGDVDLTSYRPKVMVRCDQCNKSSSFTIRVKKRVKDGQVDWLCYKCANNKKEVRERHSKDMKQQWSDKEYTEKRKQFSTELWKDEEYRKSVSDSAKAFWDGNLELKERLSDFYKEKYSDSGYREERRKHSIRLWRSDDFRAKVAKGVSKSAVLNGQPSSLHSVFSSLLKKLGIDYEQEFAVGPYVFDFVVRPVGLKPILVELHGDYWHNLSKSIERDNRKASYVVRLYDNYDFVVFWEYEFYTKNRVESRLRLLLGIDNPVELVNFDFVNLVIEKMKPKEARPFFTEYHYSGSLGRGGLIFGAFLGEELLASIVYSPVIRKEVAQKQGCLTREILEISRLAIADNRHKKNFGSWFISKTIRLLPDRILKVVSFADKTFNHDGTVYKAANFELDGVVAPSYWYVDESGWVMHKKTLYEHARSLRMRESEFAIKYKYRKVRGAERLRFVKSIGA